MAYLALATSRALLIKYSMLSVGSPKEVDSTLAVARLCSDHWSYPPSSAHHVSQPAVLLPMLCSAREKRTEHRHEIF